MLTKTTVIAFLLGWLASLLLPPSFLISTVRGTHAGA